LQTPQVSATSNAGTSASAFKTTPIRAVSLGDPRRLAALTARPPNTTPSSAIAAAPKENKVPSTGIGVVKKPIAVHNSATTESKIDTSAMLRSIRRPPSRVKLVPDVADKLSSTQPNTPLQWRAHARDNPA
jgi:hypothetical protein